MSRQEDRTWVIERSPTPGGLYDIEGPSVQYDLDRETLLGFLRQSLRDDDEIIMLGLFLGPDSADRLRVEVEDVLDREPVR